MTDVLVNHPLSRILIADDTETNLRLLRVQLTSVGYRYIIPVGKPQEVLEILSGGLPDLILLDVLMPGMDGYEVTRRIRRGYPDVFIPIILLSALQTPADRAKGLQAGANDFISRPYDTDELVSRMEAFLALKAARDELRDEHARAEALLTYTADGVITVDSDGCVTRVNPSACEMFVLTEDILGHPLGEVLHVSIADLLVRAQEREEAVSGEFSVRDDEGETRQVFSLSVSPISGVGYMLVARDITPLRELEQFRLRYERAEHARLSLLYTISNALVTQLDAKSLLNEIVYQTLHAVDAEKVMLILLDEQEIFSQKIQMARGESPRIVDKIDPTVIREGLVGWVIRHRRAALLPDFSQDPRWVRLPGESIEAGAAMAAPLTHGDRAIGVLLLISSEPNCFSQEQLDLVTAIAAQATIALENTYLFESVRRERERTEAVLTQTADGVITIDEDGYITRVNPAACDMFGLGADALGRAPDEVLHVSVADLLMRARERGKSVSGEFTSRNKESGERRVFFLSVSPVPDVGYVLVAQNVTPLKELEQFRLERERIESQRVVDALSRYMSLPVVERTLSDPNLLERRERREAVVLFADLRGFTRLTVDHPPDAVIELLDEFFAEMIEIAHYYEGVIFDFAGDELMVGFNLPYDQPDANHRALHTATHMQRRFAELKQKWAGQGFRAGMGIGISRGTVVTGSVGGLSRMNYAIVGQAVNIAHRLVEKAEDRQIIASIEVMSDGLPAIEGIRVRELSPFHIKGRDDSLSATLLELES
jgi:PAS domain S-box-containing protein